MVEVEAKFSLDHRNHADLENILNLRRSIGDYGIGFSGRVAQLDEYYDSDERLCDLGCSLRIRNSAGRVQLTFKEPIEDIGRSIRRSEIQNSDANDLESRFTEVMHRLTALGVIEKGDVESGAIVRDGLRNCLSSIGLQPVFSISTMRTAWVATTSGLPCAEIALDCSTYSVGFGSKVVYQLEIERKGGDDDHLTRLIDIVQSLSAMRPTRATKYQLGVDFSRSDPTREKIEQKILLDKDNFVQALQICDASPTIGGVSVHLLPHTDTIRDDYFDTPTFSLAATRCYLRRREQDGKIRWTFRRIDSGSPSAGVARQVELRSEDETRRFTDMADGLSEALVQLGVAKGVKLAEISLESIAKVGLSKVISIEVRRQIAMVRRDPLLPGAHNVAKLKFDHATATSPRLERRSVQLYEVEVTALEDWDDSPDAVDAAYRDFTHVLAGHLSGALADGAMVSKYAQALDKLELQPSPDASGLDTFRPVSRSRMILATSAQQGASALVVLVTCYLVGLLIASVTNAPLSPLPAIGVELVRWLLVATTYGLGVWYATSRAQPLISGRPLALIYTIGGAFLLITLLDISRAADVVTMLGFPVTIFVLLRWPPS